MTSPASLIGISKIAARFGVSESHARAMCERGEIPAFKVGKLWRADENVIEEFIRERSHASAHRLVSINGGRS